MFELTKEDLVIKPDGTMWIYKKRRQKELFLFHLFYQRLLRLSPSINQKVILFYQELVTSRLIGF